MKTSFVQRCLPARTLPIAALLSGLAMAVSAHAAGTYLTPTLDGDLSDWASVPVSYTGGAGTNAPDFDTVKISNDANYIYLSISFATPLDLQFSPSGGANLYLAFDTDNNTSTGYNVEGLGVIGSEFGYQNDYPFQQGAGAFNTNATISTTGANGPGALVAPYDSASTSTYEIGIPLDLTANGVDVFNNTPGTTISLMPYIIDGTQYGPGFTGGWDYTGSISYTLAAAPVPEPGTYGILAAGLGTLIAFGRFRRR